MQNDNCLILTLPIMPLSLNEFYSGTDAYKRSRRVKKIKSDVQYLMLAKGIKQGSLPFGETRVDLQSVSCFTDGRHRDPDNYFPKPVLDALKGWIIIDDNEKYIRQCSSQIRLNCKENAIIIAVKTAE